MDRSAAAADAAVSAGGADIERPSRRAAAGGPLGLRRGWRGRGWCSSNGVFRPELSELPLSGAITVEAPSTSRRRSHGDEPAAALNTAFATGGVRIEVAAGENVTADRSHKREHRDEGETFAPRIEAVIGDGGTLTLIETPSRRIRELSRHCRSRWCASVPGRGSTASRSRRMRPAPTISPMPISILAPLRRCAISPSRSVPRSPARTGFITFAGEGGDARVSGSYLLHDRQHADTRLVVDHKVPHCTSREIFKCVIDEDARGIFQGKVIVRPHAQKTDGKQSSHALLLSPSRRVRRQAGARNLRRRRGLRPWRDGRAISRRTTCSTCGPAAFRRRDAKSMLIAAFVDEAFERCGRRTSPGGPRRIAPKAGSTGGAGPGNRQ